MVSLYNRDCLEVLKEMTSSTIDLILTDPPYNLGEFSKRRNYNVQNMRDNTFVESGWDNVNREDWKALMENLFEQLSRVSKVGTNLIMFMSFLRIETIVDIAERYGFYYKTVGVWHKTNPMPRNMNLHFVNSNECWLYFVYKKRTGTFNNNGKLLLDYIESTVTPLSEKKEGKHPTQKPLSVIEYLISVLSNENDTVLDPFMGSGTTGVACKNLNRNFIGIELNKDYYNVADKRINL